MSMEGRCFGLYAKRTFRRRIPFTAADFLMLTLPLFCRSHRAELSRRPIFLY